MSCHIPSVVNVSVLTLRISNSITTNNVHYTVYSNPVNIAVNSPGDLLFLSQIIPSQPSAGDLIYAVLTRGSFSLHQSVNLCKFNNYTVHAYTINETTGNFIILFLFYYFYFIIFIFIFIFTFYFLFLFLFLFFIFIYHIFIFSILHHPTQHHIRFSNS